MEPRSVFSTQSGGTLLSKKMALDFLFVISSKYPFNMEMKFQFLGFS